MPVDINDILHVLAHELRTPVGIAHGYVRLLLEDRISRGTPIAGARWSRCRRRWRALATLSHETTALAAWYEQISRKLDAPARVESSTRVAAADVRVARRRRTDGVIRRRSGLRTNLRRRRAWRRALADVVRATARELRGQPRARCRPRPRPASRGARRRRSDQLATLARGPGARAQARSRSNAAGWASRSFTRPSCSTRTAPSAGPSTVRGRL